MPTVPVEISWNFIFFQRNFIKLAENFIIRNMHFFKEVTKLSSWTFKVHQFHFQNHHQKHACEMWAHSEKSTYFKEKCWLCRPFEISWNFNIFSKFTNFLQTCRTYWNHHQKHACEIWAYSEKLIFSYKNAYTAGPSKYHEISTFFQSSPNFIKLAEFIGIIIRNMHAKFEPIQRSLLVS